MNPERLDPVHDDVGTGMRLLLLLAGLASAGLATLAWLQPALTLPWALPPLHAACIGAMQAASALPWALAARERDGAALRIPLAQMLASATASVLLVLLRADALAPLQPAGSAWLAMQALLAATAAAWLARRTDLNAPAERPDRAMLLAGAAVGTVAALLAVHPAAMAKVWPWPLGAEPSLQYGAALAGWATALVMAARERRHRVRRLALWSLVALGSGVTLASAVHRGAFHHPSAGVAWAASFMSLSALALLRLARPGGSRLRAWVR
ncbi:MAG: hypothetical protein J0M00_02510 [Burkholderiales bacterium]|nr:hypothetical protein [Burkholderiales bacterium]